MRLGFKGETQVTDQLTGYGQWEYQIQGNSAENENNSWDSCGIRRSENSRM
ncbi:outer membrane porin protein C [Escherichia coli]|uniref:Outer membrane porin protein C n=1 Tax=Escherichia coli TaxID=562 RepID=A0A376S9R2_ECOLX|nr:outer membrane porin protein C [Escherichia coli]